MSSKSAAQRSSPPKRTDNRQRPQPIQRQAMGGMPNPAEMQKRLGNQGTQAWLAEQRIQPKLTIGQPGDKYEQEADRTADKVMRMPDPGSPDDDEIKRQAKPQLSVLQRTNSLPISTSAENPSIQRLCAECEKEIGGQFEKKGLDTGIGLQLKSVLGGTAYPTEEVHVMAKSESGQLQESSDFQQKLDNSKGSGRTLPRVTRSTLESAMGVDFSNVNIHTGTDAVEMNEELGAQAFTHGTDIYFNQGKYDPSSPSGKHLLAHELTHTVQQGGSALQTKRQSEENEDEYLRSNVPEIQTNDDHWYNFDIPGTNYQFDPSAEGLRNAANIAADTVSTGVDMAKDAMTTLIELYAPGALNFFKGINNFIKEKATVGFNTIFGGLSERINRNGIAGALEFIFIDLIGGVTKGIGSIFGASCSAMASVAQIILDIGVKFGSEAVAAISAGATAVGDFLNDLWSKFGAPAAQALQSFAAGIWEGITTTIGQWWDALEPVRRLAGEAWNWMVNAFMDGKSMLSNFMTDVFELLVEKWEEIKEEIRPYMGYIKIAVGVLLLMSPMGPFIVAGATAYGLYQLLSYLWQAFGQPMTREIRTFVTEVIIPQVTSTMEEFKAQVGEAKAWLSGLVGSLAAMGTALLSAIGVMPLLNLAEQLFAALSDRFQEFAITVNQKIGEFVMVLGRLITAALDFLRPVFEFVRQLTLVLIFGPFAILDGGVWSSVKRLADLAMATPCIREIAGLMQLPLILHGAEHFRNMLKAAWEIIKNPQPIIDALHDALQPMIDAVPGVAANIISRTLYPDETEHRLGVQRHLAPAIQHLQEDWWEEIKKMGSTLLWPWDEVAEKVPSMIEKGTNAVNAFFDLEISAAVDHFLSMMQDVNTILGAIWGWFAMAAVLIGGVLGALGVEFSAGATIGAGMAAGWALAETVGLVLLGAMAATEMGIIGKSMFDVRFNNAMIKNNDQRQQANEQDYSKIAGSTFSLAVVTALVILGAVAQKIASAIWEFAKARVPGVSAASEAVNEAVGNVLNKPRGERGGEPIPAEARAGGGSSNRPSEAEPARTGPEVNPEELARSNDALRSKVSNPENIREITDPQFSERYDVEVRVGDHTYRRSRTRGTWCRFSNPTCGIELTDVNSAVDSAMTDRPTLFDENGRPLGEVVARPIPERGISIEARRAEGGTIPDRVAANELDWYFDTTTRTYNKRPSGIIDPNTGKPVGSRPEPTQLYDANGKPLKGSPEPGQPLYDANGNPVDVILEYNPILDEYGRPTVDPGTDISFEISNGSRTKPTGEGWTHGPNWEKWIEQGGRISEHPDGSFTFTSSDGTRVRFNPDGEPNFTPHIGKDPWGIGEVKLDEFIDRPTDFRAANKRVGHADWGDSSPPGYTWHHVRGQPPRLQLVPRNIHRRFSHSGGIFHDT